MLPIPPSIAAMPEQSENDYEAVEQLDIEAAEAILPNGHRGWTDAASSSAARGRAPSETPEASLLASLYPAATTDVANNRSVACSSPPSSSPLSSGNVSARLSSRRGRSASGRTQNIVPPKKSSRNRSAGTPIRAASSSTVGRLVDQERSSE